MRYCQVVQFERGDVRLNVRLNVRLRWLHVGATEVDVSSLTSYFTAQSAAAADAQSAAAAAAPFEPEA